jgi:hypothetical protein
MFWEKLRDVMFLLMILIVLIVTIRDAIVWREPYRSSVSPMEWTLEPPTKEITPQKFEELKNLQRLPSVKA